MLKNFFRTRINTEKADFSVKKQKRIRENQCQSVSKLKLSKALAGRINPCGGFVRVGKLSLLAKRESLALKTSWLLCICATGQDKSCVMERSATFMSPWHVFLQMS